MFLATKITTFNVVNGCDSATAAMATNVAMNMSSNLRILWRMLRIRKYGVLSRPHSHIIHSILFSDMPEYPSDVAGPPISHVVYHGMPNCSPSMYRTVSSMMTLLPGRDVIDLGPIC